MNGNIPQNGLLPRSLVPPQRQPMPNGMQMIPNGSMSDPHYPFQMSQALSQGTGANMLRPQQLVGMRMSQNMQNVGGVGMNHMPLQGGPFVNQPPHPQQQMRRVAPNPPGPPFNQQMVMGMTPGNPNVTNMGFRGHPGPPPMGPQAPRNNMPSELQIAAAMRSQGIPPPNPGVGIGGMPTNMTAMPNNRPPQQSMGTLNQPIGHLPNNINANFNSPPPSQMTSSPRPGSSHMAMPAQSQTPISRARMTPDQQQQQHHQQQQQQQQQQAMFSNGPSFQTGTPRMSASNPSFPFVPPPAPHPLGTPQGAGEAAHALSPAFNQAGGSGGMQPGSVGAGRIPGRTGSGAGFHMTPAQQFEHMQSFDQFPRAPSHTSQHGTPQMNHSSPINHPSPSQQSLPQRVHTPSNPQMHPPRPQSQPQGPSARPPSQAGLPSHTPNPHPTTTNMMNQGGLPNASSNGRISRQQTHPPVNPQMPPANSSIPLTQQGQLPNAPPGTPQSMSGLPIASRPPLLPIAQPNGVAGPSSGENAMMMPRHPATINPPVGSGQGLIRLLQFSGVLAAHDNLDKKMRLDWWQDLIKEYFAPKALMKFTLWKDSQRQEAKPFEIGTPILPRFFLVTAQSGVQSMTLSLDGARERLYSTGHSVVECVTAVWTYKYANGYSVTLRGPLTAHVIVTNPLPPGSLANPGTGSSGPSAGAPAFAAPGAGGNQAPQLHLKFEEFQFDALTHDKYISLDHIHGLRPHPDGGPPMPNGQHYPQQHSQGADRADEQRWTLERGSIPAEPVNAFGIPQATMRCLELAESVGQMSDLIAFTRETSLGPIDALKLFASKLRDSGVSLPPQPHGLPPPFLHTAPPYQPFLPSNSIGPHIPTPSLYPPPSNLANSQALSAASPQAASTSASNSPQKQHKTIPQPQQSSAVGAVNASTPGSVVATPTTSTATGGSTPALANATLKRKQGSEMASPTTANAEQPPAKRQVRKRKSTQS